MMRWLISLVGLTLFAFGAYFIAAKSLEQRAAAKSLEQRAEVAVARIGVPPAAQSDRYDENGLLIPGPANTTKTVPTSPYEHPNMTLEEQDRASRNSAASQEVNRNLNTEFYDYDDILTGLAENPLGLSIWTVVIATISMVVLLVFDAGQTLLTAVGNVLKTLASVPKLSWSWPAFWDVAQKAGVVVSIGDVCFRLLPA